MADIKYLLEIGDPVTDRFSSAKRSQITILSKTDPTYPYEAGGSEIYKTRLAIPKISNKISDSISGAVVLGQQKVIIENDDGLYDDVEELGWFNTRAVLKRSDIDNPTIDDFNMIFQGVIDFPIVTNNTVTLTINNIYRALTQEATKQFTVDDYPDIPDGTKDKDIPIGYGPTLKNVPLFEIDDTDPTQYIAIDPDYLTSVTAVYDKDGVSIGFSVSSGVITATDAKTADVSGAALGSLGNIITSEVSTKSGINYNDTNWATAETNQYVSISGNLNFYFKGGTVRQLVDAALKSDNAFLFTRNDGRLTIRQWGRTYTVHEIKTGRIMRVWRPKKSYSDAVKFYNSRAVIQYDKDISAGTLGKQLSSGTSPAFDKERVVNYPTDLYETGSISDLGNRLIKRFGELSPIISVPVGVSTVGIDLLDQVNLSFIVNGREFSDKEKWIVRGVDPGQDALILEAKSGFLEIVTVPGIPSRPLSVYSGSATSGIPSQPLSIYSGTTISGIPSRPLIVSGEEL